MDPTKGEAPIFAEPRVITINEKQYQVRRLGVKDTFALARILAIGAAASRKELSNEEMANEARLVELMIAGVMTAESDVTQFLASIIGVTQKDFENPNKFPMGSEIDIIEALVQHEDLKAFFSKAARMMQRLPRTQTV
jgi:hypothetical protein